MVAGQDGFQSRNFDVVLRQLLPCTLMHSYLSLVVRKPVFGFPTRSNTNQAVQPHKIARCLKFRREVVEGLYNVCSENKGADQLRSYREADLRLCFRICKKPVCSRCSSFGILSQIPFIFA